MDYYRNLYQPLPRLPNQPRFTDYSTIHFNFGVAYLYFLSYFLQFYKAKVFINHLFIAESKWMVINQAILLDEMINPFALFLIIYIPTFRLLGNKKKLYITSVKLSPKYRGAS